MFLIDSSGWIEFLTDGPLAAEYLKYLKDASKIKTPTIVLYEVYKKIKRERTEEEALLAVSLLNRTSVIQLSESIALFAADLSLQYSLPMADAIVYATALEEGCKVVTSDSHFKGLDKVVFV
ncbi:MAG: type II toxin-antitoxin system VapC family toxin [Nitrospirae bacterium]|nr:type II toxin-antitoxin system VapC family toxin [Nitrospirota bacterium]MDA8339165.1 type II toxin-antitoxin system VapC family toxin [Nitrospiraceae bacterium]